MDHFIFKIRYWLFISIICFTQCNSSGIEEIPSPAGYSFSKGEKIFLRSNLEEVSGIAFVPGNDSLLMAVNDEEGKIFPVNVKDPKGKTESFRFAERGDYEDIAFFDGNWRVLESKGIIHSVDMAENKIFPEQKILPKGEYEGMAADDGFLFVACKDCPKDGEYKSTVLQIKSEGDSLVVQKKFELDASGFIKNKNKKILPSALARNPLTKDWFVLSHLNACLLITDEQFVVKEYFALPRSLFLQPEGIAFTANGDLFISSEGDESTGYIIRFNNLSGTMQ